VYILCALVGILKKYTIWLEDISKLQHCFINTDTQTLNMVYTHKNCMASLHLYSALLFLLFVYAGNSGYSDLKLI